MLLKAILDSFKQALGFKPQPKFSGLESVPPPLDLGDGSKPLAGLYMYCYDNGNILPAFDLDPNADPDLVGTRLGELIMILSTNQMQGVLMNSLLGLPDDSPYAQKLKYKAMERYQELAIIKAEREGAVRHNKKRKGPLINASEAIGMGKVKRVRPVGNMTNTNNGSEDVKG